MLLLYWFYIDFFFYLSLYTFFQEVGWIRKCRIFLFGAVYHLHITIYYIILFILIFFSKSKMVAHRSIFGLCIVCAYSAFECLPYTSNGRFCISIIFNNLYNWIKLRVRKSEKWFLTFSFYILRTSQMLLLHNIQFLNIV